MSTNPQVSEPSGGDVPLAGDTAILPPPTIPSPPAVREEICFEHCANLYVG